MKTFIRKIILIQIAIFRIKQNVWNLFEVRREKETETFVAPYTIAIREIMKQNVSSK